MTCPHCLPVSEECDDLAVIIHALRLELAVKNDQLARAYTENTRLRADNLKLTGRAAALERQVVSQIYPMTRIKSSNIWAVSQKHVIK